MVERVLPDCPLCGKTMQVYELNNAFFICPPNEKGVHVREVLFSVKYYSPNGKKTGASISGAGQDYQIKEK